MALALSSVLLASVADASPTASTKTRDLTNIQIAMNVGGLNEFPVQAANLGGFLKAQGLSISPTAVLGPQALAALVSGGVQIGTVSTTASWQAIKNGVPLVMLFPGLASPYSLLVPRGSVPYPNPPAGLNQKSLANLLALKGQTVGVPAVGGGPQIFIANQFRAAGLDPTKDLSFVTTGAASTSIAAYENKQVGALLAYAPIPALIPAASFVTAYKADPAGIDGKLWAGLWVTTSSYAAAHQAELTKFCTAYGNAITYLDGNHEKKWLPWAAAYFGLPSTTSAAAIWAEYKGYFRSTFSKTQWNLQNQQMTGTPVADYTPDFYSHVNLPCLKALNATGALRAQVGKPPKKK